MTRRGRLFRLASAVAAPVALAVVLNSHVNASGNDKVTLCHLPPGNPANAHTLSVSANAVAAHLGHGDYLGACVASPSH